MPRCVTWFSLSFLVVVGIVKPPEAEGRIVVGVSTVNVAFLPIYLTQDQKIRAVVEND
jgi:hypothetical protein